MKQGYHILAVIKCGLHNRYKHIITTQEYHFAAAAMAGRDPVTGLRGANVQGGASALGRALVRAARADSPGRGVGVWASAVVRAARGEGGARRGVREGRRRPLADWAMVPSAI